MGVALIVWSIVRQQLTLSPIDVEPYRDVHLVN